MKNVGLVEDADQSVDVYVAKHTWPYEANSPGRNKLHSFIHVDAAVNKLPSSSIGWRM